MHDADRNQLSRVVLICTLLMLSALPGCTGSTFDGDEEEGDVSRPLAYTNSDPAMLDAAGDGEFAGGEKNLPQWKLRDGRGLVLRRVGWGWRRAEEGNTTTTVNVVIEKNVTFKSNTTGNYSLGPAAACVSLCFAVFARAGSSASDGASPADSALGQGNSTERAMELWSGLDESAKVGWWPCVAVFGAIALFLW